MTTPDRKTAYPDDLEQNRLDRHSPPIRQAQSQSQVQDHARQSQGDGSSGTPGGERPAAAFDSGLSLIDGHDVIPGPDAEARGERHWDAPLPVHVRLEGGRELRTLRDAGDFLSGRCVTLDHSAALQAAALAAVRAARTGTADDVATAGERLAAYVDAMRLG